MKAKRPRRCQGNLLSFSPNTASAELPGDCRIAVMMCVLTVICPYAAAKNQRFVFSKNFLAVTPDCAEELINVLKHINAACLVF